MLSSYVLEKFMEGLGFDLLALEISAGVVEIEQDATLVQLLDEELRPLSWGCLCT